ncbi:MAG: hypothetical protein ACOX6I_05230 [Syntrophomonadaceae bacterium]
MENIKVDSNSFFAVIRQLEEERARVIAISCNQDEPWFNIAFVKDKQ